jgi:hypothetical protein
MFTRLIYFIKRRNIEMNQVAFLHGKMFEGLASLQDLYAFLKISEGITCA